MKRLKKFRKSFLLVLDNVDDIGRNNEVEFSEFLM